MPKRKVTGNSGTGNDSSPEDGRLERLPTLAARITTAKARVDEARAFVGGLYSGAERDGYHRRALKEALRLRDMEPEARRDYLTNLNRYCEKLEVFAQGELLDPMPRPPQQPDTESFIGGENGDGLLRARRLGRQARLHGVTEQTVYDADSPEAVAWHEGWHETTADNAEMPAISGRRRQGRPPKDQPEA